MKVTRVIVFSKAIGRELHRMIYPHALRPLRVGKRVLKPEVAANIMAFGSVFALGLIVGTLVMTAYGYDLETSVSAAVSAMSNMGPALGSLGPTQNWAHVPDGGKWLMAGLMLLGRLEMFSVLILFTPWAWRK
jgi:trk system potassium uptake protein TrkH